jgi:hypothetical protein
MQLYRVSNKSPTRCNNFPVYYPDVYLQLNTFRALPAHHQELNDCSDDGCAVFVVGLTTNTA